jgi:hypothetical protein
MLRIDNNGPEIAASNYWDNPIGEFLVSANAGAFRVLLAPASEVHLPDMRGAKGAAVSRGPWPATGLSDALEILFDDGTDSPFALHTSIAALDRIPPDRELGRRCILSVWVQREGKPHKALELPCLYRRAKQLPDLRPWEEV